MASRLEPLARSALALPLVLGCGDGPTIVETGDTGGAVQPDVTRAPEVVPPRFAGVTPERAAWVAGGGETTVSCSVEPGSGAVTAITVGGVAAAPSDSGFQAQLPVRPGVNLVALRAEADDTGRAVDGRAFHAGAVRPPGEWIPGAIGVHWSPAFFDDGDADKDDLAAVVEALLVEPGVLASFTSPLDTDFATVTTKQVAIASAALDLVPTDGALILDAALGGLDVDVDVVGKSLASLFSGPATLHWDSVAVHLSLSLSVALGQASAEATDILVTAEGFTLTSAALDAFAVDYPSTAKAIVPVVEELVRDSVGDLLGSAVKDKLPALLAGIAVSKTFGDTTPVTLELALESVTLAPHGLNLTLTARALAPSPKLAEVPGSLTTPEAIPDGAFSDAPLAVVIDDDLANQALAALWQAGIATALTIEGDGLAAFDPGAFPPVFQPTERLLVDLALPPTLGPRPAGPPLGEPDPRDALPFELAVGEASLTVDTGGGRLFTCVLNARAALGLEIGADRALRAVVDSRPRAVELAVGCPEVPTGYDPGNVAALWRLGVPSILATATSDFAFPLPGLPLGAFVQTGALKDAEILIQNATFDAAGDGGRTLRVQGEALYREGPARP